jgi:hypothetical protein
LRGVDPELIQKRSKIRRSGSRFECHERSAEIRGRPSSCAREWEIGITYSLPAFLAHSLAGQLGGRSNMLGHVRKTSNRVAHGLTGVPGAT